LHVLVTSRERLHIRGEHLFPLVPLALPDLGQLPDLPILAETPAVALFCAVARASRPDFVLRAEESAAVARLCVRLDGLPLAIELVAAQLALFPAAMLADLDAARTLDLPGPRDLPDRQRTLRAAIEWSFKLLPEAEQQIVTRLALFAPGWHYDAAFALCNDLVADDQHQLLHALDRLYHASFLQRLASPERFTLLETIRAFVLDRARESGILETFRMRHALHYLALAERAAPELKGSQQQQWKAALDADRDNLLLALDRLLFSGHIAAAARLCIALWRYWWMQGEMRLGRTRIEAVLEHEPALSALLRGQAWYSCAKWRNRQVNQ
jgi:predicted ATPase